MSLQEYISLIKSVDPYKRYGKVLRVVGLMIESQGPVTHIGEVCYIHTPANNDKPILAEVVGFNHEKIILMPFSEVHEIGPGCLVEATGKALTVPVGKELIGHVIDPLGQPINGKKLPRGLKDYLTEREPPNPLMRETIRKPLEIGVKAIDAFLTVGRGQRIGIFSGSGVGKSTLLGMIARNSQADINVIALLGERGREVREFIERDLGEEGLKKSIVIVATSDQPALMRIKGAYTATAISEFFREQGFHVNLLMDSITRVAMAQREVGLATGEPPTTRGYTPSVFAILPKLLERAGTSEQGSITGFYTVLVDGDDMNEPIADAVRGILDGHFILDRALAERGQFPAINILKSISRVMNHIVTEEHLRYAQEIRSILATYEQNRELIQIGAYQRGTDRAIDQSISFYPKIKSFLKQDIFQYSTFDQSIQQLEELFRGGTDE